MGYVYGVAFRLKETESSSDQLPKYLFKIGKANCLRERMVMVLSDIKKHYGQPYVVCQKKSFVIKVLAEKSLYFVEGKLKHKSKKFQANVYGTEFRKYSARKQLLNYANEIISTRDDSELLKGKRFQATYSARKPKNYPYKLSFKEDIAAGDIVNGTELFERLNLLLEDPMLHSVSKNSIKIKVTAETIFKINLLEYSSICEVRVNGLTEQHMMFSIDQKSTLSIGTVAKIGFNRRLKKILDKIPNSDSYIEQARYAEVENILATCKLYGK